MRYTTTPEHSRLYHLSRWKGPKGRRLQQLRADPFCRFCAVRGVVTEATVADHVVRWREQPDPETSFWEGELQSLCVQHHNRTKTQIELWGYHNEVDADGYPYDLGHPANKPRR
jgi:hypothetical protein